MSLLDKPTAPDQTLEPAHGPAGRRSTEPPPAPQRWRRAIPWLGIAAALLGVALLVGRLAADEPPAAPAERQLIQDPKDRPGYRSPTIDRSLTTGDAKDWPGYGPLLGDPPTGDPKDRPGYRSPTIDRPLTSGDPKDWPGYRPVTGDASAPAPGAEGG